MNTPAQRRAALAAFLMLGVFGVAVWVEMPR